jgi:hypothetical protein
MSLSALRRFKEGRDVEPYSAPLKDHELVPAQLEVVWSYANTFLEWDRRPNVGHRTDPYHSMNYETKTEWDAVKAAIDSGAPIMLGLILVGQTYNPEEVFNNHVVLAAGYSYNNATSDSKIYVYDSRDPLTIQTISLNVGRGHLDLGYTHPDPVFRGFFAMSKDSGPPKGAPASYFVPSRSALE